MQQIKQFIQKPLVFATLWLLLLAILLTSAIPKGKQTLVINSNEAKNVAKAITYYSSQGYSVKCMVAFGPTTSDYYSKDFVVGNVIVVMER